MEKRKPSLLPWGIVCQRENLELEKHPRVLAMQRFYFTLCTKDRADAACKAARSVCMAEDLFTIQRLFLLTHETFIAPRECEPRWILCSLRYADLELRGVKKLSGRLCPILTQ
jgi:hypothetical protein